MNLIDQTSDNTNLSACVSSLLGFSLEEIPEFQSNANGFLELDNWLNSINYYLVFHSKEDPCVYPCIAYGTCERGHRHCVIYDKNTLLHDPHYSRSGIIKPDYYISLHKDTPLQCLVERNLGVH
jgi:hypothetical protein